MSDKNKNLKVVALDGKYIDDQGVCPHMLRHDRCGLCLRENHYKKIYERVTEWEKRLLKGTNKR